MLCPSLSELPPPSSGLSGWPWTVETPRLPQTRSDGSPWPRISIVTPSYNQGRFIEETIRSVLLQGYPDLEYLIVDGGSTDESVEIIKKYERWLSFWVSEKDRGQTDAINKGFRKSSGEILNWLNSDDFLERGALQLVANRFAMASQDVGAVVGMGHLIDTKKRIFYSHIPEEVTRDSLFKWAVADVDFQQPACFFTREAWKFGGPLPEYLRYSMDLALWLRIASKFRFDIFPETISYAYKQPAAKTQAEWEYAKGEMALLFASLPGGFVHATAVLNSLIERELAVQLVGSIPRRIVGLIGVDGVWGVRRMVRRIRSGLHWLCTGGFGIPK